MDKKSNKSIFKKIISILHEEKLVPKNDSFNELLLNIQLLSEEKKDDILNLLIDTNEPEEGKSSEIEPTKIAPPDSEISSNVDFTKSRSSGGPDVSNPLNSLGSYSSGSKFFIGQVLINNQHTKGTTNSYEVESDPRKVPNNVNDSPIIEDLNQNNTKQEDLNQNNTKQEEIISNKPIKKNTWKIKTLNQDINDFLLNNFPIDSISPGLNLEHPSTPESHFVPGSDGINTVNLYIGNCEKLIFDSNSISKISNDNDIYKN